VGSTLSTPSKYASWRPILFHRPCSSLAMVRHGKRTALRKHAVRDRTLRQYQVVENIFHRRIDPMRHKVIHVFPYDKIIFLCVK
jgi:hypothetical protein